MQNMQNQRDFSKALRVARAECKSQNLSKEIGKICELSIMNKHGVKLIEQFIKSITA